MFLFQVHHGSFQACMNSVAMFAVPTISPDERCLVAFAAETGRDLADLERLRHDLAAPPGED